jgi:hypothetical protein
LFGDSGGSIRTDGLRFSLSRSDHGFDLSQDRSEANAGPNPARRGGELLEPINLFMRLTVDVVEPTSRMPDQFGGFFHGLGHVGVHVGLVEDRLSCTQRALNHCLDHLARVLRAELVGDATDRGRRRTQIG